MRPRNWHEMNDEQRREWQRTERAHEDALYDQRQEQEAAERRARSTQRELQGELENARGQAADLDAELEEVRDELATLRTSVRALLACAGAAEHWTADERQGAAQLRKLVGGSD